jgi:hypothetical protein
VVVHGHAEQTKQSARDWALQHVSGAYQNMATGWNVDVARGGIQEALAHLDWSSPAALQTIAAIPELIRIAMPVLTAPDKLGRASIIQVHTLIGAILVDGDIRRVRMTIRETNMGQKYYGHRLERLDTKRSGALPEGFTPEERWAVSQHPDILKIGDLLSGFKPHPDPG